ncbi:MAG TPA: hypothetical protein VME47_21180 [Acetobacteraceae bacterium]|nr:hypothetical protein [Acetobacteraceae bacterium]
MTSYIDQPTNVCGGMSLANAEESREDQVEQERELQFGVRAFDVSRLVGEPGPTPVAPEIRGLLAALVLNVAACRRWLSADPPDIREANATIERMKGDTNALTMLISTFGRDGHA